jgi:hypothetical protein
MQRRSAVRNEDGMNELGILQRRTLYGVGALLLASGLAWAVLHYFPAQIGIDERSAAAGGALLMKVHGAAAMLALILLGTLLAHHVGAGWRSGQNRVSGSGIAAINGLLVVTGYLLYYAGDEGLRQGVSWLHLAAGAILPAVLWRHAHRVMRLRIRRRRGWHSAMHLGEQERGPLH